MLPRSFKMHEVRIEARRPGGGMHGDTFDLPVTVMGQVQDGNQLVTSATGEQVVATGLVWLDPDVTVTPGSRITARGRSSVALTVAHWDSPTHRLDHIEVTIR